MSIATMGISAHVHDLNPWMVRVLIYIAGGVEVESKTRLWGTRDKGVTERVQFKNLC